MTILHSCCYWESLRKGTYASVLYSLFYFGSSCIIISRYLHEEREYLSGRASKPIGESFLEPESVSEVTVIFNILLLICAACGVLSAIFVVIGLRLDRRELLLPWIMVMISEIVVEIVHLIYLLIRETLTFEPITATLFTINFFIMCLNVYCLLCVISQYQEYKAGRGYARNHIIHTNIIQYVPPSQTNVCISSCPPYKKDPSQQPQIICSHTIIPEEPINDGKSKQIKLMNISPMHHGRCKSSRRNINTPVENDETINNFYNHEMGRKTINGRIIDVISECSEHSTSMDKSIVLESDTNLNQEIRRNTNRSYSNQQVNI